MKLKLSLDDLLKPRHTRITINEIVVFTERLSAMINAGLPVIRCLHTMRNQTDNPALQRIVYGICLDLEGGLKFSDALAKHPKVFSKFYVNLVRAGETGGILDEVLERIATHLSKDQALRRDIKKAFAYPIIVLSSSILVIGFLTVFIVPIFADVYKKMGITLPVPTVMLVSISAIVGKYWWMLLVLAGIIAVAIKKAYSIDSGGIVIDRVKLELPVFGSLNKQVAVSRILRTLSSLVSSGISLIEALSTVKDLSGNRIVSRLMDNLKEGIKEGEKIADTLEKENFFPPMVIQMISAGEESGSLDVMLSKSADFLDKDIDYAVANLVTKLEPILTTFLAVIVGFIAMAIYLPMFDVMTGLNK